MEDYKPNSYRSKSSPKEDLPKKKINKVVTGKVRTKKKNEISKFKDIFILEDISTVGSHIFKDILVPSIKKAVSTIVKDGIDMVLYGEAGNSKRSTSDKISYRDYYASDRGVHTSNRSSTFDYSDLIFDTRGEAEAVRQQMDDVIDAYGFVTVADMYDMADLTAPFTANKYGWTNIRSAEIVMARGGGYIIKLPRAVPID